MNNKDSHIRKAVKHYAAGHFEKALYWYTMAITLDENDADLFSERGVTHYHLGNLKAALSDMDRARDLEPNNPYRYSSRAYIRDAMGDLEGAVKDYQQTIFLDSEDAIAHNNLGLLEEKLGRHSAAKALFNLADQLADGGEKNTKPLETVQKPVNIQKLVNQSRQAKSIWREARNVFTTRAAFADFITFVRKGFK